MSAIETYLNQILSAIYGKDVRSAIHDAIEQCYDDVSNPDLNTAAFKTALEDAIEDGTLTALSVADGSISTEKLADGAVTAAKLASASVSTDKIVDAAITAAKLYAAAVTTEKIADGAVTLDKMGSDVDAKFSHIDSDYQLLNALYIALSSNISTLTSDAETYANGFEFSDDGLLYLTHNNVRVSSGIRVATSGGGLAFDSGYQDDEGYIHLTLEGEDIEGFDPFLVSGGSGSGSSGSKLVFAIYTAAVFSVLSTATTTPIYFKFTSVDSETSTATGNGNLAIYVGGILKETKSIAQGDNLSIDLRKYLANGSNTVRLVMTDTYGAVATRTLTITVESFTIEWNLGDTEKNSGNLTVYVTPTGSGSKVLYLYLDGALYETKTVTTTGRRVEFTVPMAVGMHTVSVYGTMEVSGVTLTSETLTSVIAETATGSTTVVVAAKLLDDTVSQYTTLNIPYRVIDPSNNPADVTFLVDGTQISTASVDQSEHIWSYRATASGSHTLAIRCGSTSWTKTITVDALSSDVTEVTANLVLKIDPNVITDLDTFSYSGTTLTPSSNFDSYNGGLQLDDDGIRCIKIMKGDRLTVNYNLFGVDSKLNGRNFKIIYKIENASDFDGTAISCLADNIGITIKANSAKMQSEQTSLEIPTCEGYKTELELDIEPDSENRLMMFWEKGVPTKAAFYSANDNFRQTNTVGITVGSDTCDVLIYLIRVYSRDLTKAETMANYCADGKDATEILARYDRNQCYDGSGRLDPDLVAALNPNLHVLVWHAAGLSESKEQQITGTLTHKYTAGGASHSWTASGVKQKAQGTSSLGYVNAGCNEDFNCENGFDLEDTTHSATYAMTSDSIGVNYFNFKTNVASQEHINNILLSDRYNTYQQFIRTARANNSKVRDTIEGHLAVLFFHNTGSSTVSVGPYDVEPDETIFCSLGCFNNSKKNNDVFEYDDIVIELRNNISDQVRFKSDDLSAEDWSGDVNFEFRYLNESVYTQAQAQAKLQDFLTWMVSCDADEAPNTAFATSKTIDGQVYTIDNAAYRKAKFKSEASTYMEVDSFIYHFLSTLVYSQVDNRAKNVFLAYNSTTEKWNVVFAYDNDTGMGNDNEGGLTLKYGYMDTDVVGTRAVFNASDSALWAMFRYCYETEIRNMYISLENDGAWDLDSFADTCDTVQDYACESIWIEDVWRKDIDTYTVLGDDAYIPMLNGKKRLQRRQFLHYQRAFMASYFVDAYAVADTATIRGYTPSSWSGVEPASQMTVKPYIDLWITIMAGTTTYKQRTTAGTAVTVSFGNLSMNDTEIYVRCASFITDLGDLAPLYPGVVYLSSCSRLQRAQIGSSISGYENTNLHDVSVSNAKSLEYINVENCPNLAQELNLANNINVKECYTRGSGVTGVTFANRGRLVTAYLNALASIYANQLSSVETFSLESYESLTSVNIKGGSINTLAIALAAVNINRVRLIDIDWSTTIAAYKALRRIYNAQGIDDDGYNTDHGVLAGECYFDAISQTKYEYVTAWFDDVDFTYGQLLDEYTVTFTNYDGTTLYVTKVESGGTAEDPVEEGLIETPTKPADTDYTYTYYKWDLSLENITENCTRVATFTRTTRYNTVIFQDYDGTQLQTFVVAAHGSCQYTGADLTRSGYVWQGWDQDTSDVTSDMTVTAVYFYPTLPAASLINQLENYDFAYSDDPEDSSAYTAGEFYSIMKMGHTADYLSIGCKCKLVNTYSGISDTYIIFQLHAIGHYRLVDDDVMSNADWYMIGVLNSNRKMNSSNTNDGGWDSCALRTWLNSTLYPHLPVFWRNLITRSITKANAGNQSSNITDSNDYLRIPSYMEVGFGSSTVPYNGEADSEASEYAFSVYTSASSRIKKTFNNTGTAQNWWLRSADSGSSANFRYVNYAGGGSNANTASNSNGVCVGFSV